MAFDNSTRNRLASFVKDARNLIADEFTQQFQHIYGISEKGEVTPLDQLREHLDDAGLSTATLLRERIDYLVKTHPDEKDGTKAAVDRLAREQAFTVLNRLAAIRMVEKRDLIAESVGKGYQSKGFKVFEQVAGSGLGETYQRYRRYLYCLFDELAVDLGVLFDRSSPQGVLFPREPALLDLLKLLNASDLETLWTEDETIGWIYQYYNDPAERKKMREAGAPRNSRELAVRNQFFTPRYVVEFLTDNTLGRIWYEMTQGQTRLKDQCRYLVRRPTEIFLKLSETVPDSPPHDNVSQEELLKQPIYIPHRPVKDPREIRMLDPACGSMHFGLYAFDLFEVIYEEAWDIAHGNDRATKSSEFFADFVSFAARYANKAAFLADVPRLIIEQNIHGIDIDPRCTQIAGLSLWLRAQKSWQLQKVALTQRPRIRKSNIVCAEPMPGDQAMLREFVQKQFGASEQPAFARLLETIFDKMQLAGEAGSLLKIEEEIRSAVEEARKLWEKIQTNPRELFSTEEFNRTLRPGAQQKLGGLEEAILQVAKDFWKTAEERIYAALRDYAEQAENGGAFQRRLFADDAARGFAFIDVCRKLFDVALMNPPFGEFSSQLKHFAAALHEDSKSDIGFSMITRGLDLTVEGGCLGALISRLFIVNDSVTRWRHSQLMSQRSIDCMVDLGYGVLDDAMVEVSAVSIRKRSDSLERPAFFLRVLDERDKEQAIDRFFSRKPLSRTFAYTIVPSYFKSFNKYLVCYWLPNGLANLLRHGDGLASAGGNAHFGASTSDDFQFARLRWEVTAQDLGDRSWVPFAKGGEYAPFFDDIGLVLEWRENGRRLKEFVDRKSFETQGGGGWTRWINGVEFYFREGLTYPERTTSDLCPQVLPRDSLFSAIGSAIHFSNTDLALSYLGAAFTRPFKILADAIVGSGDGSVSGSAARHYRPGIVNTLPAPGGSFDRVGLKMVVSCVALVRARYRTDETSWEFTGPCFDHGNTDLTSWIAANEQSNLESAVRVIDLCAQVESVVISNLALSREDLIMMDAEFGAHPASYSKDVTDEQRAEICNAWAQDEHTLVDRAVSLKGARRQLTKKSYFSDRRLELIAHTFQVHPASVVNAIAESSLYNFQVKQRYVGDLLSYSFGCVVGRWDIRFPIGDVPRLELPDPFAPLPICPPGQLQNAEGLPARPEDVPSSYPISIPWDGILVDDPNHGWDIERSVRKVIEIIWKDREEAIEHETCELLGAKSLRDYFRKPTGFFADHLKRYSKSRRQAPIYWPLSTASGSYTLWIYYHRLSENTLHTALADFIDPKLKSIREEISYLRNSGNKQGHVDELSDLEQELKDFRAEIERIIKLPWKPNLNDGVLITASPLWKLFRLPKWQKDLKACWEELSEGEYDWAHLAYTIWPDRVEAACKTDRSIAIAHGLEHLCKVEAPKPKSKRKKGKDASFEDLEA